VRPGPSGAGGAARPVLHPARVGPPEHAAAAPAGAAVAPPAGAVPLSAGRRPAPRRCVRGQRGPAGCGRRVVPGGRESRTGRGVACPRRVGVTAGPGRPARPGTGIRTSAPPGHTCIWPPTCWDTGVEPSPRRARASEPLPAGHGHLAPACRDTGIDPSPRQPRASEPLPAGDGHLPPARPVTGFGRRTPAQCTTTRPRPTANGRRPPARPAGYGRRTLAPPGTGIRAPARRARASGPRLSGYGHRPLGRPAGYRHSDPRLPARASAPRLPGYGHPNPCPPGTGIRTPAPKPSPRSLPRGRAQSRVYVSCSPLLVFTRWRVSPGSSRTWVAAPGVQALRGRPLVTLDGPSCSPPESEAEV